jgi:hypothetical protein
MANGHTNRKVKARTTPQRKLKRTFSLSVQALAYIDGLAKEHRSASEALERMICEQKAQAEKDRVSAGIRNYYDSISDEQRAENLAWGELAGSQLLKR